MQKYSVLMTIYKNDNIKYARESINSMLMQTIRTDDFVIVCDGPLTKELYKMIEEYDRSYPGIFHIIKLEQNVGLGSALRRGVHYCKNDIIARMDDDDIAKPERCEKELAKLEELDVSIVGSYVNEFDNVPSLSLRTKKVPITYEEIIKFSKRRNPFNHSSVMFRKKDVLAAGNYSSLRTNQDVELWIRMLNNGFKGVNIEENLVDFRFEKDTYYRRKMYNNIKIMIKLWKKFLKQGYCDMSDYLYVVGLQIFIFLSPVVVIKWAYNHLR